MDAERWQQVRVLFRDVFELDPEERASHLDLACADDATLRREVERFLAALDEAGDFLLRALEIRRRRLDEGHPHIGASLRVLALFYSERDDPEQGAAFAREAAALLREAFSPEHWRVGNAESILGACLAELGRHAEAEPLLRGGYKALREQRGEAARPTREALDRLIRLYEISGRPETAEELRAGLLP